jgi:uncharacterized protein YcgI (DUF1989 family)
VNLFLDAVLTSDGSIEVRPSPARRGERWTARVLIDGVVAVTAGRTGIPEASVEPPTAVRVGVTNRVEDLPEDLPLFPG